MKPRQLIPDHKIIVILDTSPVRDLAFETVQPSWIKTFSEMAADGYSFSLAEAAAAELLNQVRTSATPLAAHQQAIAWVSTFLNPEVPVLPGKMDVEGMIGLLEDWDVREASYLATMLWEMLCAPLKPDARAKKLGYFLSKLNFSLKFASLPSQGPTASTKYGVTASMLFRRPMYSDEMFQ